MAVKKREEKEGNALMKVALGCRVEEVTEEYAEVDGELKLTKRRETKKDIPPDLKAVQMLLAAKEDGADYAAMSDEQLNAERERLLAAGFTDEEYARLHAPIGLAIGAQTPEEIAVSVAAEMIAVRAGLENGLRRPLG